jgi:hypothetical protein
MSGTWTGTLSRPNGLTALTARWQLTQANVGDLSGPFTLTNGNSSVTFQLKGSGTGPNNTVATVRLNFGANAGSIATLPNCSILSNGGVEITGLKDPITSMTTNPFSVNYAGCQGFVDPPPFSTFVTETTQLTLTKQ